MSSMMVSSLSKAAAGIRAFETSDFSGPILRTVPSAVLVGISYYVGTRIGFAWTPTWQPNSTFWPANAILLAALLLAPRKAWWTFLLAALPAHVLAQLQAGVPVSTALGWFITNISEGLIGAYCIRRFIDARESLDSVRGVLVFVGFGVVFAPLATSFLDAAAVVLTGWGRQYWPLGMERFWTNALAELTIVPAIVLFSSKRIAWIRSISVRRWGEAALLASGIVLAAELMFGLLGLSPVSFPALLYVPLPFLLWAAARFGLGGLSLTVLCLALISTWHTMHGRAPFPYASMSQNVLSLQILFCVAALPLMFLSAVIAEARHTRQSLRRMSSGLIEAQEQERARIGRELHDDINQRLGMLAVELEQLQQNPYEVKTRLQELRKQTIELSDDVQALSHELHASKLEYLGVAAGMNSWCREFSLRQSVEIDFRQGVSSDLSAEIGLCLFRVLQEALHNALKHSGVKHIEVELKEVRNEIHLIVTDLGRGFDVQAAIRGQGLGLTSMRERVRLLNGNIEIRSTPMMGTTIHVRVPLESMDTFQQAVG